MATFHIAEAEVAENFADLMNKVRAGTEVSIESGSKTVAVLRSPDIKHRTISETIALAEAHSRELGYAPVMDEDFAADMREIIAKRKPRDTSAWDQ